MKRQRLDELRQQQNSAAETSEVRIRWSGWPGEVPAACLTTGRTALTACCCSSGPGAQRSLAACTKLLLGGVDKYRIAVCTAPTFQIGGVHSDGRMTRQRCVTTSCVTPLQANRLENRLQFLLKQAEVFQHFAGGALAAKRCARPPICAHPRCTRGTPHDRRTCAQQEEARPSHDGGRGGGGRRAAGGRGERNGGGSRAPADGAAERHQVRQDARVPAAGPQLAHPPLRQRHQRHPRRRDGAPLPWPLSL